MKTSEIWSFSFHKLKLVVWHSVYFLPCDTAILKRPRTPPTNNSAMDYQTADSEHVLKRSRPFAISDEVLI